MLCYVQHSTFSSPARIHRSPKRTRSNPAGLRRPRSDLPALQPHLHSPTSPHLTRISLQTHPSCRSPAPARQLGKFPSSAARGTPRIPWRSRCSQEATTGSQSACGSARQVPVLAFLLDATHATQRVLLLRMRWFKPSSAGSSTLSARAGSRPGWQGSDPQPKMASHDGTAGRGCRFTMQDGSQEMSRR
jgi:hypothetical protein